MLALVKQEPRTTALQEASRWRGKQGSPYNTTHMRLIYNAFAPTLFGLAKSYGPDDIFNVRDVVLRGVRKFDRRVAQHCREVTETVKKLWSLGVFHWDDCRQIVLGGAIAAPTPCDMGKKRKRGKKEKQGAHGSKRARKARQRKGNGVLGGDRQIHQVADESKTDTRDFQTSLGGVRAELQTQHDRYCFNPSTVNAHDEGDPDLTMVDSSSATGTTGGLHLLLDSDDMTTTCVDIFKAATSRDARDGLYTPPSPGADATSPCRSLEDAYVDNPDAKLSNLDEQTLGFAGKAVKQVVFEATYDFLHKCIPASDQQKVWKSVLGYGVGKQPADLSSIPVPHGILDLKNGKRPLSHLMGNCIYILSQDYTLIDQRGLRLAFNQGIVLCDALNDGGRKKALEYAAHALSWLMLGLDCKTMELYRSANQELDKINANYIDTVAQEPGSFEAVCDARGLEECEMLSSIKASYEKFKEPFRVNFIETLKRLLAAEV
ncbi:hypothetical protein VPNG_09397 [Cytospora leucostoma]|uniref:Uncharacterized protein n=1 Tax=Cytospora leucostoma TaxID=1230097 RepID=A0A423VTG5_9PEZI|nr:hypothetical protein VPNG_09397 [Cytospora leucostoma]